MNDCKKCKTKKIIICILIIIIVALLIVGSMLGIKYLKNDNSTINPSDSSNSQEKNDNQTNVNENNSFSDEIVKDSLQEYLDLIGTLNGSPKDLLVKLGLLDRNAPFGEKTVEDDKTYISTDIKTTDFKSTTLKYMTEKCYEKEITKWFKFSDTVSYMETGGTGRNYKVDSINKVSNTEYEAKVKLIAFDDSEIVMKCEFTIANYNGNCVIDSVVFK